MGTTNQSVVNTMRMNVKLEHEQVQLKKKHVSTDRKMSLWKYSAPC